MIRAIACAKVNLTLRVGTLQPSGLHRIGGIFQSISWVDHLEIDAAEEDSLRSRRHGEVVDGWDNLAWRAVVAVRRLQATAQPVSLCLDKEIPVAAGLGGGSADAAAALAAAGNLLGAAANELPAVAAELGSDVPFCWVGGTAEVSGTGATVRTLDALTGFALAIVVPPVELATAKVFRAWDELGGPTGPTIPAWALPPALRGGGPAVNDLYPAAVRVAPLLEEWRADLAGRWSRPVALTGSGPALFAFFVDEEEAASAVGATPAGARASSVAIPVPYGWALQGEAGAVVTSNADDAAAPRVASLFADRP